MREEDPVGIASFHYPFDSEELLCPAWSGHKQTCPVGRAMTGVPGRPESREAIAIVHHLAVESRITNVVMWFRSTVPVTISACVKNRHARLLFIDSYLIGPP